MHTSLIRDFGILRPKIVVLGLNPHAGDSGIIGEEDEKIVLPAVEQSWNKNMLVYGPFSADGFFGSNNFLKFDGILAMYHDQGMIPFKTLSFDKGVNFTAGLPFVRTSPAHGTAYDIAGKNLASHNSFREAVHLAVDIFKNRKAMDEHSKNPLPNYLKELAYSNDAVIEKEMPHPNDENSSGNMITGR
jgi:4-hydroxythreonine-4-phosphate dehydrogenase